MMRVNTHGGMCCGVKHIFSFPGNPDWQCSALEGRIVYQGAGPEMDNPGENFYPGPRDKESGSERLKALLEYVDEKKTSHLLEVILHKYTATNWDALLKKHGFRLVTVFHNSNTHNTELHVYHRVTYNGKVVLGPKARKGE